MYFRRLLALTGMGKSRLETTLGDGPGSGILGLVAVTGAEVDWRVVGSITSMVGCALGRLTGSLSVTPESPVVCPNCGSDHVVLLAVSGEIPNREQNPEDKPPDPPGFPGPNCDLANHSDHPSGSDGTPPQASVSHGCNSWSLSPSEYR